MAQWLPNLVGILAESPVAMSLYLEMAGAFDRTSLSTTEQQVVLLTVAVEQQDPYTVAGQSYFADSYGVSRAVVDAVRDGASLGDPRLEALRSFARRAVHHHAELVPDDADALIAAGFTPAQVIEVLTGVAEKIFSSSVIRLAEPGLDPRFAHFGWSPPKE